MSTYTGTKSERQGLSSREQPIAVKSANAKSNRLRQLNEAIPAMRALWGAGVAAENHDDCIRLYVYARVERDQLAGELGVLDRDRIGDIAEMFGRDRGSVEFLWWMAKTEAETAFDASRKAAQPHFEDGKLAIVGHTKIADTNEIAVAFEKTAERDHLLFGRKLIRPHRLDAKGHWAKTPRIRTGIRTLAPSVDWVVVPAVPDGPGAQRFTTAERKALAIELGVKIATVRAKERNLAEIEFEAWADRRRRTMATRAQNETARRARQGRRRRTPGKTDAIRRLAACTGRSVSQTWRRCEGMATEMVLALVPQLVEQRPMSRLDRSDIEAEFQQNDPHEVSRKMSRESDSDSDKNPKNPAFSRSPSLHPSDLAKPATVTRDAKRKRRRQRLITECERFVLDTFYRSETGRTLSDGLVRQWRHRGVLLVRLKAAIDWLDDQDDEFTATPDTISTDRRPDLRLVSSR